MTEKLISLIYVSSALGQMDNQEILDILKVSRQNNEREQITGMLLFKGGNFMQVLEGPEEMVLARYERIRKDARHKDVNLLNVTPIQEREFSKWEMGFSNLDGVDAKTLPGYSPFMEEGFYSAGYREQPSRARILLTTFKKSMR